MRVNKVLGVLGGILAMGLAALCQVPPSLQPRVAGVYVASNYDYGHGAGQAGVVTAGGGTSGSYSITLATGQIALAGGAVVYPFSTTAPITINDANPETVTPSAVSGCSAGNPPNSCVITATFSNAHGIGASVASGTHGLQEAINDASSVGGVVVIDGKWASLGGTNTIIAAATLPTNTRLADMRGTATTTFQVASGSTDAIAINAGTVVVTATGADAMTLPTPTSGTNDGLLLRVVSTTAHAHTITATSNKINNSLHVVTFSAAAGDAILLVAYGGVWYSVSEIGATIS